MLPCQDDNNDDTSLGPLSSETTILASNRDPRRVCHKNQGLVPRKFEISLKLIDRFLLLNTMNNHNITNDSSDIFNGPRDGRVNDTLVELQRFRGNKVFISMLFLALHLRTEMTRSSSVDAADLQIGLTSLFHAIAILFCLRIGDDKSICRLTELFAGGLSIAKLQEICNSLDSSAVATSNEGTVRISPDVDSTTDATNNDWQTGMPALTENTNSNHWYSHPASAMLNDNAGGTSLYSTQDSVMGTISTTHATYDGRTHSSDGASD